MENMNNTGSTSTVVSITDRLYNIVEDLIALDKEIDILLTASNKQDFIPDPDGTEWHPISIARDQRWENMDMAATKVCDTIAHLTTAHDLSIKVDKE